MTFIFLARCLRAGWAEPVWQAYWFAFPPITPVAASVMPLDGALCRIPLPATPPQPFTPAPFTHTVPA